LRFQPENPKRWINEKKTNPTFFKFKVVNNTVDRKYASVKDKVFTYSDGRTTTKSDEGWSLGPNKSWTFGTDYVQGHSIKYTAALRVKDIE
jgi:hypothetical protein